jgi:hypothetical protein
MPNSPSNVCSVNPAKYRHNTSHSSDVMASDRWLEAFGSRRVQTQPADGPDFAACGADREFSLTQFLSYAALLSRARKTGKTGRTGETARRRCNRHEHYDRGCRRQPLVTRWRNAPQQADRCQGRRRED